MALTAPAVQFNIAGAMNGAMQAFTGASFRGMKHLANAGVDPHTVGSMLLIGELVPVSSNFRIELHQVRDSQRKKSKAYCGLIEIGAWG